METATAETAAQTAASTRESVSFHRRPELPGVEVRDVHDSDRQWRCFSTGFEFLAPRSWHGEVFHRRRQTTLGPGMVLCAHPGEVFSTPRVHRGGSGSAVIIDPDLFYERLAEHTPAPHRLQLRGVAPTSGALASRFGELCAAIRSPWASGLELEVRLAAFVAAVAAELVEPGTPMRSAPAAGADTSAAARVRDRLSGSDGESKVQLDQLSEELGLSRFQLMRAFKRRYGLPPHAYQLRVRVGLAQRALAAGQKPADVAAQYGFVDQSHLSAHFRRLVGVTPAEYARARGAPRAAAQQRA